MREAFNPPRTISVCLSHLSDILHGVWSDAEVDRRGVHFSALRLEMKPPGKDTSADYQRVRVFADFTHLTMYDELTVLTQILGQQGALQITAEGVLRSKEDEPDRLTSKLAVRTHNTQTTLSYSNVTYCG